PALADLDGDGILDVIVTDYTADMPAPVPPEHVYAFKGSGTLLWKTQPKDYFGNTLSAGDPVVADVLGDGNPEVLFSTNSEICVLSRTGVQLTDDGTHKPGAFSFYTTSAVSGPAVDDMESDGVAVEVVAISGSPFPAATDTQVYVWNPKPPGVLPWSMFRQNHFRTGLYPGTPSCGMNFYTLKPCRVFDTRLPAGPLGGPIML